MKYARMLVGAGALTAMGVLVAPGLASAHSAAAEPSCTGLSVTVGLYPEDTTTVIVIDGNTTTRTGDFSEKFPWDSTRSHTWAVDVQDEGFPFHRDGTWAACTPPPPPPETTTTTTVPETTTTVPETTTTQPGTPTTTPTEPTTPTTQPGTPITQDLVTTTTRASSSGGSTSGGSSSSGGGQLPSTGPRDTAPFIAAGIAALVGGSALIYVARRRGTAPS